MSKSPIGFPTRFLSFLPKRLLYCCQNVILLFFFLKFCKVKETSIFFHITKFKLLGGDSHHTESLCMEVGWVDRWANILQCLKDNVLIPLLIHCSIFSYKVLIYPKSHSQNLTMSCLSSRHFSTVSLVNYRKY